MTDNTSTILRRGWSVFGKLVAGTRKGPSGDRVRQLRKLQKQIGVRFLDLSLLEQALTHRSYSHVTSRNRDASNERMEFLGDSVLGLAVSQFLYLQFPDRPEGALSKMKSLLVSRKVLSEVSRDNGFGEFILLSGEESDMGGRDRDSILADSYEGVIGAIYLDQGYRAASKFIEGTLLAEINEILKDEEHTNYKSLLQEYVQSRRLSHPVYRVHAEDGPEHEKEFVVDVVVKGEVWGQGRGKNKKDAEQAAAREAIDAHRRKTAGAARQAPARTGRWRTGSTAAPARPAVSTAEGPGVVVEDPRHGVRASRELLRAAREAEAKTKDAPGGRGERRAEGRRPEERRAPERRPDERREERRPGEDRRPAEERRPGERWRPEGSGPARRTDERRPHERRPDGRRSSAPTPSPSGAVHAPSPAEPGMAPATGPSPLAGEMAEAEARPSSGRRRGRRGGRGRSRPGMAPAVAQGGGESEVGVDLRGPDRTPPGSRDPGSREEISAPVAPAPFEREVEPAQEVLVSSPRRSRLRAESEEPGRGSGIEARSIPAEEQHSEGPASSPGDEEGFASRRKKRVVRGGGKRR